MSPGTININEMLPTVAMIQQNSQRSLLESSIQHLKKKLGKNIVTKNLEIACPLCYVDHKDGF